MMGNHSVEELKKLRESLKLHVEGEDLLKKTSKKIIMISNHNCLKDIFYLPLAFQRDCISLISSRLIYNPIPERQDAVQRYLLSMPIEAHGGSRYASMCLEVATSLLCAGYDLNIFPEGAYLEDSSVVHRGRTGASRILFSAKERGEDVLFLPVAIDVKQKSQDLDNFDFSLDDEVSIYVLDPISYEEQYQQYQNSNSREDKNHALHEVVDVGMEKIAKALNRKYDPEYIPLYPKGNVMFANGDKVMTEECQSPEFMQLYQEELQQRAKVYEKRIYKN